VLSPIRTRISGNTNAVHLIDIFFEKKKVQYIVVVAVVAYYSCFGIIFPHFIIFKEKLITRLLTSVIKCEF